MKNLEEMIKKTNFTQEDWTTFKKVEKNCRLDDLKYILDVMRENEELTEDDLTTIDDNINIILEKYDDYLEYDWKSAMTDAIKYVCE